MTTFAYRLPRNKYGVIIYDICGTPIIDRPHCANTIRDAINIAMVDMVYHPFSCATVYKRGPEAVRHITCAGEIKKP